MLAHNASAAGQYYDVLIHTANVDSNDTTFARHALICGANATKEG